jgi:hypothetical protein
MAVNYHGKKFYKIGPRSEPDVGASRTRMGLSRHVLDLIEKTGQSLRPEEEEEDSSEVEKNRKEKRESPFFFNNLKKHFSARRFRQTTVTTFLQLSTIFIPARPHPPFSSGLSREY